MLSLIVAIGNDWAIGSKGDLLCHLSGDLRRFKQITTGHTVLMGRNTFASLPNGALPNRKNIVLTSDRSFEAPNVEVLHSWEEVMPLAESEEEIFVMGGGKVYEQALPYSKRLYITHIEGSFPQADTFFPVVDWSEWQKKETESHEKDERNDYAYTFALYERK